MLDDLLRSGLRLVICGTAVGARSAKRLEYYAGKGNRFWHVLQESGLTPNVILGSSEFTRLADFGIGLTDLAKGVAGNDHEIPADRFDREALRDKMLEFQPRALAFNGKKAASIYFARNTRTIEYGLQEDRIGATALWVLPSTSGAARGHWRDGPWKDLRRKIAD